MIKTINTKCILNENINHEDISRWVSSLTFEFPGQVFVGSVPDSKNCCISIQFDDKEFDDDYVYSVLSRVMSVDKDYIKEKAVVSKRISKRYCVSMTSWKVGEYPPVTRDYIYSGVSFDEAMDAYNKTCSEAPDKAEIYLTKVLYIDVDRKNRIYFNCINIKETKIN